MEGRGVEILSSLGIKHLHKDLGRSGEVSEGVRDTRGSES